VTAIRQGAFKKDEFPSAWRRSAAFSLLFMVFLFTVLLPAAADGRTVDTARLKYYEVFTSQGLLLGFLGAWWLLAGRPPLLDFLALRPAQPLQEAGAGLCLGLIGWGVTFLIGVLIAGVAALLKMTGPDSIPPLIVWLANLAPWKRLIIVLSAMTVEEFYFRAFLQKRMGPLAASVFFLLAHAGYGEPLFFAGILGITVILAVAFEKTGSVLAPMVAHGTFNAVQLFVVLPAALRVVKPG
jgi:membrane protease YdiL (CAAX protease family)